MADVSERAEKFSQALQSQQQLMVEGCRILTDMSSRFQTVCSDYEPVRLQALDLTTSQSNIESLKELLARLVDHLKAADRVKGMLVSDTAERNLNVFLAQLDALNKATEFFMASSNMEVSTEAIGELKETAAHAYRKCGHIIVRTLKSHSRPLSRADLEDILTLKPADRPAAVDVYISKPAVLQEVRRLVAIMLAAGEMECVAQYCAMRHEHVQAIMRAFGAQPEGSAVMSSAPLERRVDEWVYAMRALAQLVAWEQELAVAIFPPPHAFKALLRSVQASFDGLLATGTELSRGRGQPDKIFPLLQMVMCLRADDVAPLFQRALPPREIALGEKLKALLSRIHADSKILIDVFSEMVAADASVIGKDITVATSVAPQTAYAMRFLKNIFKRDVAEHLFFLESRRDFVLKTVRDLQANLEAKVLAQVKDRSAAAVVMVNNVNYVRLCVEEHDLLPAVVGEGFASAQLLAVKRWKQEYFSKSWEPLLAAVQAASADATPQIKKDTLKEHFKRINTRIEKLHEQSLWSMHDTALRAHLRGQITSALIPFYQDFWQKYHALKLVTNPQKYFKYSPEELDDFITHDLFTGRALGKRPDAQVLKSMARVTIDTSNAR